MEISKLMCICACCLGVQIKELITTLVIMSMGLEFHTKRCDACKGIQNSSIMVKRELQNGNVPFFGLVTDIVELYCTKGNSIVFFKCE